MPTPKTVLITTDDHGDDDGEPQRVHDVGVAKMSRVVEPSSKACSRRATGQATGRRCSWPRARPARPTQQEQVPTRRRVRRRGAGRRPGVAAVGRAVERSSERQPRRTTRRWMTSSSDDHDERDDEQDRWPPRRRRRRLSFSMLLRMRTEVTSVLNGRLPDSSTSEPYSLTARANDSAAPAAMAGMRLGRTIRRKVVNRLAPERRRRLLDVAVELGEHRLHGAHDERQGDEQEGDEHRRRRVGDVDAERAVGPVERQQHQAGDDGGQGERDVDEHLERPLAEELVAHQHPGDERAHDDVDDGDQERRCRR